MIAVFCPKCPYAWLTSARAHLRSGCPSYAKVLRWGSESFIQRAQEIHGDKYDYSGITDEQIKNCYSHIPIKCKRCKNIWSPTINNHIHGKTGCPKCSKKNHSRAALDWIRSIENSQGIMIQTARSKEGEYHIKKPDGTYYRVDGYHRESNTVYEYYGDYYHGNPSKYKADGVNTKVGKTYGQLFKDTIDRENHIRSLGYNIVSKWETPLPEIR